MIFEMNRDSIDDDEIERLVYKIKKDRQPEEALTFVRNHFVKIVNH